MKAWDAATERAVCFEARPFRRFGSPVSVKKTGLRSLLLLASLLIGACQSLPGYRSAIPYDTLPRHRFALQKDQTLIGGLAEVEVEKGDSLALIGRYFGLGFDEITQANPELDPWIPEPGRWVRLPLQFILPEAPHRGIVLNLAAKRLFYYPKATDRVFTYPVGIGREGWETPQGRTRIVEKKAHPNWIVPVSVRREHARKGDPLPGVVPAGPDNPLGDYALRLGMPGYLIHGTNKPYGVGMEISHGCVRLFPEDISQLFRQTPSGTPVRLVNQPYLTAWQGGQLFLQAHRPVHEDQTQIEAEVRTLIERLQRFEQTGKKAIDWARVNQVLADMNGVPTPILTTGTTTVAWPPVTHPAAIFGDTVPAPLTAEDWSLQVASFNDPARARRLAAMLNHQGPAIPAHVLVRGEHYRVLAGPFASKRQAESAAKRIRLDFAIDAELIKPGATAVTPVKADDGVMAKFRSLLD